MPPPPTIISISSSDDDEGGGGGDNDNNNNDNERNLNQHAECYLELNAICLSPRFCKFGPAEEAVTFRLIGV